MNVNRKILDTMWMQIVIIILAITVPLGMSVFFFANGLVKQVEFSSVNDNKAFVLSLKETDQVAFTKLQQDALIVESYLSNIKEVKSFFYSNQTTTSFSIYVNLQDNRNRSSTAIVKELNKKLTSLTADTFIAQVSQGTPIQEYPINLTIYGNNVTDLEHAADSTAAYASMLTGVSKVDKGYSTTTQYSINVNQDKAIAYGLTSSMVGLYVRSIFSTSTQAGNVPDADTGLDTGIYLVDANGVNYQSISDVNGIQIPTASGMIHLSDIATITQTDTQSIIKRDNGSRYITVNIAVKDDKNILAIQNKAKAYLTKDKLALFNLPPDAVTPKGVGDSIATSFTQLGKAIILSLFLTYLIFVLFFRSFTQPFIIVFAVPLTFIGIFPVLYIFNGGQIGFLETLGIITLIGIVENVGIFVIDYANRCVREGMEPKEAIILSTGVRFRPIFLTKVTALGSLLPLAVLSPFWRGLSLVVIVGILISGILSLFTTPIFYMWFYKLSRLVNNKLHHIVS